MALPTCVDHISSCSAYVLAIHKSGTAARAASTGWHVGPKRGCKALHATTGAAPNGGQSAVHSWLLGLLVSWRLPCRDPQGTVARARRHLRS